MPPSGRSWDELAAALDQALKQEQSDEQQEVAVVAQGLAKAATLLAGQYQLGDHQRAVSGPGQTG